MCLNNCIACDIWLCTHHRATVYASPPRSPHRSVIMAWALNLVRGPGRLRSLSLGLSDAISSIVWFLYMTNQLSFQIKISRSSHLCCLGLLYANSLVNAGAPLTGMSKPSPSFPDEIFLLCLWFIFPQYQTTSRTFDREIFRNISLFWRNGMGHRKLPGWRCDKPGSKASYKYRTVCAFS